MPQLQLSLAIHQDIIPYQYSYQLASAVHKWLKEGAKTNNTTTSYHGQRSLFAFSHLLGGRGLKEGITFAHGEGSCLFSSYDSQTCQDLIAGLNDDPTVFGGVSVQSVRLMPTVSFRSDTKASQLFRAGSPILLKLKREDGSTEFVLYDHPQANELLTQSLTSRLEAEGYGAFADGLWAEFVPEAADPKVRLIQVGTGQAAIANKASLCAVRITGQAAALEFAHLAGIGQSTGMGFGFLTV